MTINGGTQGPLSHTPWINVADTVLSGLTYFGLPLLSTNVTTFEVEIFSHLETGLFKIVSVFLLDAIFVNWILSSPNHISITSMFSQSLP